MNQYEESNKMEKRDRQWLILLGGFFLLGILCGILIEDFHQKIILENVLW